MDFTTFLGLFGGLALFLFGMNVMSTNLEKMAGGSLETTLRKVTSNKLLGFALGCGITAVIQSSSAMTVMLVGLVNSGIIPFEQAIPIVLGSNIGTTLTAWIMSLIGVESSGFSIMTLVSPDTFVPVLAFIGILMRMISKKEKYNDIGTIMLGFAVLMYGMEFMSDSMKGLTALPGFVSILTLFKNPILAFLAGTVFTAIIQSSSAAIGIIQAIALSGVISYQVAIPLIIGANVGTCATALLSSIGAHIDAKRVTFSHLFINIFGGTITLAILLIADMTPAATGFLSLTASSVSIAIIHTVFNIINTLLIWPLQKVLVAILKKLFPDEKKIKKEILDDHLLATPATALAEAKVVANEMALTAEGSFLKALSLIENYNPDIAEEIRTDKDMLNNYEDRLSTFLFKLNTSQLSEADAQEVSKLLSVSRSFNKIGKYSIDLRDSLSEMNSDHITLSENAKKELSVLHSAMSEILDLTIFSYTNESMKMARKVEPLKVVNNHLMEAIRKSYLRRLTEGTVSIDSGNALTELLSACIRIDDHCANIAINVLNQHQEHDYIHAIREESDEYQSLIDEYTAKYSIK